MAETKKTTGNTKADPRGKVTGHLIVKNYEHGTEVDLDCGIADAMFMMVIAAKRLAQLSGVPAEKIFDICKTASVAGPKLSNEDRVRVIRADNPQDAFIQFMKIILGE